MITCGKDINPKPEGVFILTCTLPENHKGPCQHVWPPKITQIDFKPKDAEAIYLILIAARALDGVLFNHDEWDSAMSAFGRLCIIAQARQGDK